MGKLYGSSPFCGQFFNASIDLARSDQVARKYPSYVWQVRRALMVQERCGASVQTAAPSPWSTLINRTL